jgi:carboxylesterase
MGSGDPFDLDGDDDVGVVLVHGFTGTPYEVGYLGRALAKDGFTICAPRLPGHGTSLDDLDRTRWEDWVSEVERAADRLAGRCRTIALVGQSLGGLLCLYLASRRPQIARVASLAAPLWLDGLGKYAARWTGPTGPLRFVRRLPKLGGSDVRDPQVKAANPCYPGIPTRGLAQLVTFMRIVDGALPLVTQPTLVMHATQDHTAPVACARYIVDHVAPSANAQLRILEQSYHLIAVDVERDIVAADVSRFLQPLREKDTACAT